MRVVGIPFLHRLEASAFPTAHRALVPEFWIDGDPRPPCFMQQVAGQGPRAASGPPLGRALLEPGTC
jgi:hypothetical protein